MWKAYQRREVQSARPGTPNSEEYEELKEHYQLVVEESKIVNRKLKESRENWMEFGDNLLGVTKELLSMATTKSVSEEELRNAKLNIKKCESFLNEKKKEETKNEETKDEFEEELNKKLHQKSIGELHKSSSIKEQIKKPKEIEEKKIVSEVDEQAESFRPRNNARLDYAKIKTFFLISGDESKISAILQALTDRILKKKSKVDKLELITEYTHNDILDCNGDKSIIKKLLEHSNTK
jgi:O6-methylguanine-DNA--protein-cysteine methyltransferase